MVPPPSRAHLEKMAVAKRRRKLPVDPPTRVSRPSSPAEGQDHSQIRRRERTSCVKNRMREFRTSGSVRGGDGDIPTYSAESERDRLAACCVGNALVGGISVALH